MNDRRPRAQRYRVRGMHIVYDTGEAFWAGAVINHSESGLFIETQHELPTGTRVTLIPDVPDEAALPFELQAEVARVSELDLDNYDRTPGIAFRLLGLSPEQ